MIGYLITAARYKVKKFGNDRAAKAISCATIVMNAPLNMVKKIRAAIGKTLPSHTFATSWSAPSMALAKSLRSRIISCI